MVIPSGWIWHSPVHATFAIFFFLLCSIQFPFCSGIYALHVFEFSTSMLSIGLRLLRLLPKGHPCVSTVLVRLSFYSFCPEVENGGTGWKWDLRISRLWTSTRGEGRE